MAQASPGGSHRKRWSRRQFLWRLGVGLAAVPASGGVLGAYGHFLEPRFLDVSRVPVRIPGLPPAFQGTTIAVLADLHVATAPDTGYLHSVVDRVLQRSPSMVALVGDYVITRRPEEREVLRALVSRLTAPLGVYAVLGNHDHWLGIESTIEALSRGGATILRNDSVAIRRDGQTLYLAGVDDVWEKLHDLPAALSRVPPGGCTVLLAHEPDFADEVAQDARVALQLSGHSHAGQVRLPGVPRVLPYLGRKYPEGLRRVGSLQLYTSRGIGEVEPTVRINCPPELPVISLMGDEGT